jgi:diguanylate cyclase (GGDEF)-like protein
MDKVDVRLEILAEARRLLKEYGTYSNKESEERLKLLDDLIGAKGRKTEPTDSVDWARLLAADLLQNQALLVTLKRQADELDAFKKLSLNLTSSLNIQTVLDAVVTEAMHLVKNARTAYIYLYTNGTLEFGASLNQDELHNQQTSVPRSNGLTYAVAKGGENILVEDMQVHPLYIDSPKDWTGSIIGIALKSADRVLGVMTLSRSTIGGFSPSELRLLRLLADHAVGAISNAREHELLNQEANNDTVTGLPNRRALDHHLGQVMSSARSTGHPFGVVMMDVDGFKAVNDSHGHTVGDQVLRTFFNYLATGMRSTDFLARYGGDELTLILTNSDPSSARVVVEKILEKVEKFHFEPLSGEKIHLRLSCGIAFFPIDAVNAADLVRAADEALYRAKKQSRGSYSIAPGTAAVVDKKN